MFYQDIFVISCGIILLMLIGALGTAHYFSIERREIKEHWLKISDLFSLRYGILPNLIMLAQKYASHSHEKMPQLIEFLIDQRAQAEHTLTNIKKLAPLDNEINKATAKLVEIMESSSQSKKDVLYHEIAAQIKQLNQATEKEVGKFNKKVYKYNKFRQFFPFSIVAFFGKFGRMTGYLA